jgi:hypothetical protein
MDCGEKLLRRQLFADVDADETTEQRLPAIRPDKRIAGLLFSDRETRRSFFIFRSTQMTGRDESGSLSQPVKAKSLRMSLSNED